MLIQKAWSLTDIVTWTLGIKILCLPIQGVRSLPGCRNCYSCDIIRCGHMPWNDKTCTLRACQFGKYVLNIHHSKDIKWMMQSWVLTSWPMQIWKASNYAGMRQPEVMPLTQILPIPSFLWGWFLSARCRLSYERPVTAKATEWGHRFVERIKVGTALPRPTGHPVVGVVDLMVRTHRPKVENYGIWRPSILKFFQPFWNGSSGHIVWHPALSHYGATALLVPYRCQGSVPSLLTISVISISPSSKHWSSVWPAICESTTLQLCSVYWGKIWVPKHSLAFLFCILTTSQRSSSWSSSTSWTATVTNTGTSTITVPITIAITYWLLLLLLLLLLLIIIIIIIVVIIIMNININVSRS